VDLQKIRADLQFKFWVTSEGKVVSLEILMSSGDPTVDLIGMRYLRQWQFSPKEEETEWGIASFSLAGPPGSGKETP